MPTARELLEQADALMRRNRGRNDVEIPILTDVVMAIPANDEADNDVPLLTDVVGSSPVPDALAASPAPAASPRQPAQELRPSEAAPAQAAPVEADHVPAPARPDSVAILRSVEALPVELPMEGDTSDWLVMDTIDPATHSITGAGPDTLAVVPPVTLRAPEGEPALGESLAPVAVVDDAAEHAARAAAEDERWRALAEQVSMQVLQRIDLFTDTGLKTELAQHLQPIVERASAELIRAITDHVGGVLRTYVAEAIEREIAAWKRDH